MRLCLGELASIKEDGPEVQPRAGRCRVQSHSALVSTDGLLNRPRLLAFQSFLEPFFRRIAAAATFICLLWIGKRDEALELSLVKIEQQLAGNRLHRMIADLHVDAP